LRIWEYTAGWFEDLRPGEFCGQWSVSYSNFV
jgi:hypothetical protein